MFKYFIIGLKTIITFPFKFIKYFLIGVKTLLLSLPTFLITKFSKSQKKIPNLILGLSLITYLLCVFILTRWYVQNERTKNFTNSMNTQEIITIDDSNTNEYQDTTNTINTNTATNYNTLDELNYLNVNLNYYINKNSETVGWIKIKGTKVNYPIVQHKDNNYYLNHDFYKRKTDVGWIFADYRNDFDNLDNNTIIYGHNLINRTMFGDLPTFLNKSWLNKENKPYIKLSTKKHNSIWQIFSVYKTKPTVDYLQAKFNSIENYTTFINTLKSKSAKNLNVEVLPTDKILTLSTCDDTGKYRVAVHAKLIKIENK